MEKAQGVTGEQGKKKKRKCRIRKVYANKPIKKKKKTNTKTPKNMQSGMKGLRSKVVRTRVLCLSRQNLLDVDELLLSF